MRLLLIRHGHPNYELDCLTPLGHLQAEAAAERLKSEGIDVFFSSTCGRAVETAEHTASKLALPVTQLEFMREVSWGCGNEVNGQEGHPWNLVDRMILEGESLRNPDWMDSPPFKGNIFCDNIQVIEEGIDAWLETLGYTREGEYYRAGENSGKTVALFSHGGSSNVALAHILNMPLPFVLNVFRADFTSITVLNFPDTPGALVMPVLELVNDSEHIRHLKAEQFFGN